MINNRLLIFGNSGSGKTYLASIMSQQHRTQLMSLDDIYWQDEKYLRARSSKWCSRRIKDLSRNSSWIIEGIYSHLLKVALPRTTMVIWLDIEYTQCMENIQKRGKPLNPHTEFRVEKYYSRRTGSSWESHNNIYQCFNGEKMRITSSSMMSELIKGEIASCLAQQH